MATSGVNILTRSASDIVTSALRRARIIPVRQPVSSIDLQTGIDALNNMVAELRAQGWHLWKSDEYVLFLDQGVTDYQIGPTGDRAVLLDDFIQTLVTVETPDNEQSIEITSTSEFSGSDDVLDFDPASSVSGWTTLDADIESTDGTFNISTTDTDGYAQYEAITTTQDTDYFFQINITSASATVRIEALSGLSLTVLATVDTSTGETFLSFTATEESVILRITVVGAGGEEVEFNSVRLRETDTGEKIGFRVDASLREWNIVTHVQSSTILDLKNETVNISEVNDVVFAYKNLPPRPLKLRNYRSKNASFDDEIPMNTWSRSQYMKQTIKTSQGLPTQAYYDPKLDDGRLYLWQTANDVNQIILFTGDKPLEIFIENANTPDFPAEWFNFLSWGVAAEIGPEYGIPNARQQVLEKFALTSKETASDWDEEQGSLLIGPDDNGGT